MLLLIYFNASLLFKSINLFHKKGIILKKGKEQQPQEILYHQR